MRKSVDTPKWFELERFLIGGSTQNDRILSEDRCAARQPNRNANNGILWIIAMGGHFGNGRSIGNNFNFTKNINKQIKSYSGGKKEKFSTAVVLLGSPGAVY